MYKAIITDGLAIEATVQVLYYEIANMRGKIATAGFWNHVIRQLIMNHLL